MEDNISFKEFKGIEEHIQDFCKEHEINRDAVKLVKKTHFKSPVI